MNFSRKNKWTLLALFWITAAEALWAAEMPSKPLPDAPSSTKANALYTFDTDGDDSGSPDSSSSRATADRETNGSAGHWVKRLVRDQVDIYTSPFHASAVKWDIGLPLVTIGLIAIDKHASDALPGSHLKASNAVDSGISNVGYYGMEGVLGVMLVDGLVTHNAHARESGILGAETWVSSAGLYAVVQLITERDRPFQDAGKGHFWQHSGLQHSFPSGHSMFAWGAATTLAHEYPKTWVKWLVYGTATAVSVTRFTTLQHFPSDVVAGGALGFLVGRHIFHAHCKPGLSPECKAE